VILFSIDVRWIPCLFVVAIPSAGLSRGKERTLRRERLSALSSYFFFLFFFFLQDIRNFFPDIRTEVIKTQRHLTQTPEMYSQQRSASSSVPPLGPRGKRKYGASVGPRATVYNPSWPFTFPKLRLDDGSVVSSAGYEGRNCARFGFD